MHLFIRLSICCSLYPQIFSAVWSVSSSINLTREIFVYLSTFIYACLSVCLTDLICACLPTWLLACPPSVLLQASLPVCLYVCMHECTSVLSLPSSIHPAYLCAHLSVCSSLGHSVTFTVCLYSLFIKPSICLSIRLFVCLSIMTRIFF